jgi:hypothetical protein
MDGVRDGAIGSALARVRFLYLNCMPLATDMTPLTFSVRATAASKQPARRISASTIRFDA